jgi:hypothetical protein
MLNSNEEVFYLLKNFEYVYFVNKEKRQVVCKLRNKKDKDANFVVAANNFMMECLDNLLCHKNIYFYGIFTSAESLRPSQSMAIAKCHPDDVFNVEIGKRIARNKLRRRILKQVYKRLHIMMDAYKQAENRMKERYPRDVESFFK